MSLCQIQSAQRGHTLLTTWKWITPMEVMFTTWGFVREISTWRTKQPINLSWRYVSTKPVRRLLSQKLPIILCHHFKFSIASCAKSSPSSCHYVLWSHFLQSSEFLNIHLFNLDGLKTRCMTSALLYLLYSLFKWLIFTPARMGSEILATGPRSELAKHKQSSWMTHHKLPSQSTSKTNPVLQSTIVLELWPILWYSFGDLCVWSIFKNFEHSEHKSEIVEGISVTTNGVIEDSWCLMCKRNLCQISISAPSPCDLCWPWVWLAEHRYISRHMNVRLWARRTSS